MNILKNLLKLKKKISLIAFIKNKLILSKNEYNINNFLLYRYILGYRSDFKNNIFSYGDGNKIIYPAGNVIVILNSDEKHRPTFLTCHPSSKSITCMA